MLSSGSSDIQDPPVWGLHSGHLLSETYGWAKRQVNWSIDDE